MYCSVVEYGSLTVAMPLNVSMATGLKLLWPVLKLARSRMALELSLLGSKACSPNLAKLEKKPIVKVCEEIIFKGVLTLLSQF